MISATRKLGRLLILLCGVSVFLVSCKTTEPNIPTEESPAPIVAPVAETPQPPVVEPEVEPKPETPRPKQSRTKKPKIVAQAQMLGADATEVEEGVWEIVKGDRALRLKTGERVGWLNEVVVRLHEPFDGPKGNWALSESDFEHVLKPSLNPPRIELRSNVVVLDPGHGGSEPGATNTPLNLMEKELNLDVAVRVQQLLESKGVKVVMTRYNDRRVSLEDRSEIANRSSAGVFVSIHFNSAVNPDASGIETFSLTPSGAISSNDSELGEEAELYRGNEFNDENFELSYRIQSQLVNDLQRVDRGVKRARFKVLKDLECPGVLVECGFLSHDQEAPLVNTPVYRQKLAESLASVLLETLARGNTGT